MHERPEDRASRIAHDLTRDYAQKFAAALRRGIAEAAAGGEEAG